MTDLDCEWFFCWLEIYTSRLLAPRSVQTTGADVVLNSFQKAFVMKPYKSITPKPRIIKCRNAHRFTRSLLLLTCCHKW